MRRMIRLQEVKVLKSFSQFREESLKDRIAAAAKKNKDAIKNKRGVGKPKGFKDDEPELKQIIQRQNGLLEVWNVNL